MRLALYVSVFFWVLALDHDLRVASDIIGSVFVRNPAGTKVALWEEVALDEGKESTAYLGCAHRVRIQAYPNLRT
jgi:hypothetical protein